MPTGTTPTQTALVALSAPMHASTKLDGGTMAESHRSVTLATTMTKTPTPPAGKAQHAALLAWHAGPVPLFAADVLVASLIQCASVSSVCSRSYCCCCCRPCGFGLTTRGPGAGVKSSDCGIAPGFGYVFGDFYNKTITKCPIGKCCCHASSFSVFIQDGLIAASDIVPVPSSGLAC